MVAPINEPVASTEEPPVHPVGRRRRRGGSFWKELPILVIVALGLALLIKAFLVQAFYIPSGSMERTLMVGDRVLVNKLVYRFRPPHRGEIVVFNGDHSWTPEVSIGQPTNPVQRVLRDIGGAIGIAPPGEEDFIKRVIAVGGDTVACCNARGQVTVNGVGLHEPYIYQNDHRPFGPITVPAGRLWVMGDHRAASADSRAHIMDPGHGTIPVNEVVGRAFVIIWPLSRLDTLGVPSTFHQPALNRGTSTAALAGDALAATPYALGTVATVPLALYRRRRRRRRGRARSARP